MNDLTVYAPLSGRAVKLSEVPDEVFSDKILGDGAAIIPELPTVMAPFDGVVSNVSKTFHAICVTSSDGIELLIHLGIDTVKLNGKGFDCRVKNGDKIRRGDVLMKMDLDFLRARKYNMICPCIITNLEFFTGFEAALGRVTAGSSKLLACSSATNAANG